METNFGNLVSANSLKTICAEFRHKKVGTALGAQNQSGFGVCGIRTGDVRTLALT
jgi:hypothetical protein